ncbi:diaminopimelate epimerase [Tepidicella baoligensis]|uniref:diaminopimelate epimerase n=1 Tax=Tepidicella baoligensis TaxID=2707016 RepID=UPI0015DB66CE|nr:diaminopimelate epimerase [Tepidicella baoligensis]
MRIPFTKMQGAGNDFVVLDETQRLYGLTPAQYRFLADRHFGVGADQILSVRPAPHPGVDFAYVIHNADGAEVENCGNGARCFVRYVHDRGLVDRRQVRVQVHGGEMTLRLDDDGRVTVDMGPPVFELPRIPFEPQGLTPRFAGSWEVWPLPLAWMGGTAEVPVSVLSMGNPHAVWRVDDVAAAPVADWGPLIERHACFPRRVNAGFVQVVDRRTAQLRVFERGVGETLACGTGACAAVVAGIRHGWFDERVEVHLPGGILTIAWAISQGLQAPVLMTGPAEPVFEGVIDVPDMT